MVVDSQYMEGLTPGSSEWWLRKGSAILNARRQRNQDKVTMLEYEDYYRGDHPLLFASPRFREVFGGLFKEFADNFCGVRVDALVERLAVRGFRYGANKEPAEAAWRVWQANGIDVELPKAFREAFVKSEAAFIVGPGRDPETPEITVEDPTEVVVVTSGRRRVVAIKRWFEAETDRMHATLYYPDRIEKWQSTQAGAWFSTTNADDWSRWIQWERRQVAGEEWGFSHGLGVVPVVPIVNNPDLKGRGLSELKSMVPLQGAINKLVLDMMVAAEFSAFRQRWITGIDLPKDPTTGEEVAPFRPGVDSIWTVPPGKVGEQPTQFGDFEQTDLEPFTKAIEMLIQHAATEGRLPLHYLLSTNVMPNAESQDAAEAGLVAKVHGKITDFSDPIEEVNALVFRLINQEDWARIPDGETVWKDPAHRSEAQHVDAITKLATLNLPEEVLWEKYGASPIEIARWRRMREEEAQLASVRAGIAGLMTPAIDQGEGAEAEASPAGASD